MRLYLTTLVLIAATLQFSCGSDKQTDPETVPNDPGRTIEPESDLNDLQDVGNLIRGGTLLDVPFALGLGSHAVTVMYRESNGALKASVRADGFDGPLESLAVFEELGGTPGRVLLHIHKGGIYDGDGNRLVDQIPAENGYAWRVGTSSTEAFLGRRSFISVILLDENGAGISDELYIYWNPEGGSGKGFVVTNIPNEIL